LTTSLNTKIRPPRCAISADIGLRKSHAR
jgi:hypothetical protein